MTVATRFAYNARDAKGRKVSGTVDAPGRGEALVRLKQQGLSPWSIVEEKSSPTLRGAHRRRGAAYGNKIKRSKIMDLLHTPVTFGKKLPVRQQSETWRQLGGLIKAGLPLDQALELMVEVTRSRELKIILGDTLELVRQGRSLSDSLTVVGGEFPKFAVSMIRAGEASGDLEESLTAAADVLRQNAETRALIRSSLAYPLFVLGVSMAAVLILVTIVVPRFLELFAGWDQQLPAATRILVDVNAVLTEWGGLLALAVILGVLGSVALVRVSPGGRMTWGKLILRIPLMGPAIRDSDCVRLTRTLAVMLRGGVALPVALDVASGVVSNAAVSRSVGLAGQSVRDGVSLGSAWRGDPALPPSVSELVAIGERTGDLPLVLDQAADLLDEETRQRFKYMTTLLEPALLLCMAVIVGFVVTAILLPIISMTNFSF